MSDPQKKIVLLTALPNGRRLASLRTVERFDSNRVILSPAVDDARPDSIPFADCLPVEGGEHVSEGGLGIGIREISLGDLAGGSGESGDAPGLLEAFEIEAGAPVYVVRGGDQRDALHDALRDALPPETVIVSCPPGYRIDALDPERMRALGWVRAEDAQQSDDAPAAEND